MRRLAWVLGLALSAIVQEAVAAPASSTVRRVAVVVGANQAAPGRSPLRFAYKDAESVAEALVRVGGFAARDVIVLRDPSAAALREAIARAETSIREAAAEESMMLFYYSGHADQQTLFPNGEATSLATLKADLDRVPATVCIGVLDACRGGGWTRAKGLTTTAAFEVPLPEQLSSEGSVFLASSSGLENAHEAEALQASFFTHHWVAGLLGAADRSGDGLVTLGEAYDYAKELTIRDSARHATDPQHPSFDVSLRGRQDLVVAQVSSSPSLVHVVQEEGPLEVIHLGTGLVVLEMPQGKRTLKLALAPGKYLVRRRVGDTVFAREVVIAAESSTQVREADLELVGSAKLALKGDDFVPRVTATTVRGHIVELRAAAGIASASSPYPGFQIGALNASQRSFALTGAFVWGFTDRFSWSIGTGAFAYRFGEPGKLEVVPRGGVDTWGIGGSSLGLYWLVGLNAGADVRIWAHRQHSIVLTLDAGSRFGALTPGAPVTPPDTWRLRGSAGYTLLVKDVVSLNLGVGFSGNLIYAGHLPRAPFPDFERDLNLSFGSVQSLGLRPLPLVQFHALRWLSIDLYATIGWQIRTRVFQDRYLVGATFSF